MTFTVPHTFSDGPGNTASGEQVSENFTALLDVLNSAGWLTSKALNLTVGVASNDPAGGGTGFGAAFGDIAGTELDFTPAAAGHSLFVALVAGRCRTNSTGTSSNPILGLDLDGVVQAYQPQTALVGPAASDVYQAFALSGVWLVSLTAAAHVAKIQMKDADNPSLLLRQCISAQLIRIELGA